MPSRSQVPGRNGSSSTSALAASSRSLCGSPFTSRSTTRLPRCIRSRSSRGIDKPPGRRTRTTSAPRSASTIAACGPGPIPPNSITLTPARGLVLVTRGRLAAALLDRQNVPAQPVGAVLHRAFDRLLEDESGQWHRQVNGEFELHPCLVALRGQRVLAILSLQLSGADQRPTHDVVGECVLDENVVADSRAFDLHPDLTWTAVIVGVDDLG